MTKRSAVWVAEKAATLLSMRPAPFALLGLDDHSGADRTVGRLVDQHEAARRAIAVTARTLVVTPDWLTLSWPSRAAKPEFGGTAP